MHHLDGVCGQCRKFFCFPAQNVALGLDIEPAKGSADSGDIEIDLPNLFQAIDEAASERQTALAILIDEIQYLSSKELGALIMAMHRMQQKRLPVVLLASGLTGYGWGIEILRRTTI